MSILSATQARKELYRLVDSVAENHEPVVIAGKRGRAVLLSEDDWRAIQETLHLVQVPGMVATLVQGQAEPVADCSDEPGW